VLFEPRRQGDVERTATDFYIRGNDGKKKENINRNNFEIS
jgi:hypothetical protein